VLPSVQEEAAEKLDEHLTPIEITKQLKHVKDDASNYTSPELSFQQ